jgi:hypothetical protein
METYKMNHPAYSPMLYAINAACYREEKSEEGYSVLNYFHDPVRYSKGVAIDSARPIVFNRSDNHRW